MLAKQYTSIGGQAVIEGVMMRSPNAFVVALRKPTGEIRLRKDHWYGISKKFPIMNRPFFRGILMLIEAMLNGIVALNYSANIALDEDMKKRVLEQGKTIAEYESEKKQSESVDWGTYLTIGSSFIFAMGLFVFIPHAATEGVNKWFSLGWHLNGLSFHILDGAIKAIVFILYVKIISYLPDIRRVFEYHGAEHKSISTFEAGEELTVENARKFSTYHPRCGTSFIFFLLLVSIIIFSGIFASLPIGEGLPRIPKHILAIGVKIVFMIPVAGIAYEVIKFSGRHSDSAIGRIVGFPGKLLQRLTTREPSDDQLEVALASIKTALLVEGHVKGSEHKDEFKVEEIDIKNIGALENTLSTVNDFLEN